MPASGQTSHDGNGDLQGRDFWSDGLFRSSQRLTRRGQYGYNNEYGNGAAIFAWDVDVAHEFKNQVKIGMVGADVRMPLVFERFGGWKRSLFRHHSMHVIEGVPFYTRYKVIALRWPTGIRASADFIMPTME